MATAEEREMLAALAQQIDEWKREDRTIDRVRCLLRRRDLKLRRRGWRFTPIDPDTYQVAVGAPVNASIDAVLAWVEGRRGG